MKIAVVDDDLELLEAIEPILEDEGYKVETVDSMVFNQVIENIEPDLVILDVWFGDSPQGITLAQSIKQKKSLQDIPLVIMSSDSKVGQYAIQARADSYLQKPFSVDDLLQTIKSILR